MVFHNNYKPDQIWNLTQSPAQPQSGQLLISSFKCLVSIV